MANAQTAERRLAGGGPRLMLPPAAGSVAEPAVPDKRDEGRKRLANAASLPVANIVPDPSQPRKEFPHDDLIDLAFSIRTNGQLQPIRVRWIPDQDAYMIITGERRWRAHREILKWSHIECLVDAEEGTPADPLQLLLIRIAENVDRKDLHPRDEGMVFLEVQRLLEERGAPCALRDVAATVRVKLDHLHRSIMVARADPAVQEAIAQGRITKSAAEEIARVDDHGAQRELLDQATRAPRPLTYAEVKEAARQTKKRTGGITRRRESCKHAIPVTSDPNCKQVIIVHFEGATTAAFVKVLDEARRALLDGLNGDPDDPPA